MVDIQGSKDFKLKEYQTIETTRPQNPLMTRGSIEGSDYGVIGLLARST